MPRRQFDQFLASKVEKWLSRNEERADLPLDERCEGCVEVAFAGDLCEDNLLPHSAGGCLQFCSIEVGPRIGRIFKHADHRGFRYYLKQQLQSFRDRFSA